MHLKRTTDGQKNTFSLKIATLREQNESHASSSFVKVPDALIRLNAGARNSLIVSEGVLYSQVPLGANRNKILGPASFRNFEGLVATVGNKALLSVSRNMQSFGPGIVIPGQTYNWWHWLVEVLPKAFLASQSGEEWSGWPIMPRSLAGQTNPRVQQTARMVLDGSLIEWAPADRFFHLKEAVFWDGPVELSQRELAPYRELLRQKALTFSSRPAGKRIFLKRAERLGRKFNQSELASIAQEFGFEIVDPEEISLSELWAQLANATVVVGAQGAGWANTIVCPEGSIGLQWAGGSLRGDRFQKLADLCKMDLRTMVSEGDFDGDYRVDSADFASQLKRAMRDADDM